MPVPGAARHLRSTSLRGEKLQQRRRTELFFLIAQLEQFFPQFQRRRKPQFILIGQHEQEFRVQLQPKFEFRKQRRQQQKFQSRQRQKL